jgi:hypothetical protein|tara:strand:- start:1697 stop:1909 length:213 start_codon:yes stop_codon:yes gene_type:complete
MHGYGVNAGEENKVVVIKDIQNKIDVLKHEVGILKDIYKSMDQDGGRFNTAASVLEERIKDLEFKESFRK